VSGVWSPPPGVRPSRRWGAFFTALFVASLLALLVFFVVVGYLAFGIAGLIGPLTFGALLAGLLFLSWPRFKGPGG
jgi:hypothetical protein